MLDKRKVIFMGERVEVHARLVLQVVAAVVYAVCHAAVSVEVFLHNMLVGVAKTL